MEGRIVTSWTAEFEWHEDLWTLDGLERILDILERDLAGLSGDFVTGTVTATVTVEAPSLLPALLAARDRVKSVSGREVMLNRITTTDAYNHAVTNNRRVRRLSARALISR